MKLLIGSAIAALVAARTRFTFKGWSPKGRLSDCEGDCDSNRNCQPHLYCAQTNHYLRGHNCSGRGKRAADYCVRRAHSAHFTFHGWSPKGRLGRCQGDCDSNRNCKRGLVCAQTNTYLRGHGCRGRGRRAADYCVRGRPAHSWRFTFHGWSPKGRLGRCQGDCDSNRNCKRGLRCAQTNGYLRGHGCHGRGKRAADYCVRGHPAHSWKFTFFGWGPRHPLGRCQGDCDSNRNCRRGLVCAQTNGYLRGHGCRGRGRRAADYCVRGRPAHSWRFTFHGWSPRGKLGRCQGDCDGNHNCKRGLYCAQTNWYLRGHGCRGRGRRAADYCVRRFHPHLQFLGWSPKHKLNKCQGDCDGNKECRGHMKCIHDKKRIRGCRGINRVHLADYCA